MTTENDYDRKVFNGDLGRASRIDQPEGALMAERSSIRSANSPRSFWPT
jgi:hypothetical protein